MKAEKNDNKPRGMFPSGASQTADRELFLSLISKILKT